MPAFEIAASGKDFLLYSKARLKVSPETLRPSVTYCFLGSTRSRRLPYLSSLVGATIGERPLPMALAAP
jgi:hypothetical protein